MSVTNIERPIWAGVRGKHDAAIGRQDTQGNRQSDTPRKDGNSVEWKTKIGGQTESSGQKETKRGSRRARVQETEMERQREKWQDKSVSLANQHRAARIFKRWCRVKDGDLV